MTDPVHIRPVDFQDGDNGLFDVLSQLTTAPKLSPDVFRSLVELERQQDVRRTLVAVNPEGRVQGTGAALIETKFIRGGRRCGHIEDIVVDKDARGSRLGKRIIKALVDFCKERGCYKVILDCAKHNVPFYDKCGFVEKEVQMVQYL